MAFWNVLTLAGSTLTGGIRALSWRDGLSVHRIDRHVDHRWHRRLHVHLLSRRSSVRCLRTQVRGRITANEPHVSSILWSDSPAVGEVNRSFSEEPVRTFCVWDIT